MPTSLNLTMPKKQHTGVPGGLPNPPSVAGPRDLVVRHHFTVPPQRWAAAAVLQALAVSAVRAGELVNNVPVVAVGGRSLSIAAGLLSESTVWAVLRTLRDMPGAPILLVTKGTGLKADRYALTKPDIRDPHPNEPDRPMVTDVHDAWSVIGLQHRRVYETIAATGLDNARQLAAAARTSQSSTYNSLAELARIGLVRRRHGTITLSDTGLDDIRPTPAGRNQIHPHRRPPRRSNPMADLAGHTTNPTSRTPHEHHRRGDHAAGPAVRRESEATIWRRSWPRARHQLGWQLSASCLGIVKLFGNACGAVDVSGPAGKR